MLNAALGRLRRMNELSPTFRLLLAASFLIPLAGFMVMPFMSFFLHDRMKMDLEVVGLVIAVASFVQMSGGVVGGYVADRFGLRRTMVVALVIRTISFALFVVSIRAPALSIPALLLSAVGVALYLPANKAYVVRDCDADRRPLFLSLNNAALNSGMALGPLISGLFIMRAPMAVFAVASGIFAAVTLLHVKALPPDAEIRRPEPRKERGGAVRLLLIPPVITAALGFYAYMFFQNYLSLYVVAHYSSTVFSVLLLINGLLVVALQPVLAKRINGLGFPLATALSFALFACGLLLIGWAGLLAVVVGVVLISLGEVVLFLKSELEALRYSPDSPGVVFGNQRLATGIGAFASAWAGGWFYQRATDSPDGDSRFWIYCAVQAAIGGLLALAVSLLSRRNAAPADEETADEESAGPGRDADRTSSADRTTSDEQNASLG
ncbi:MULTISPECIES: MFS transporter [Streptomyces]|uniref:Multidrug resistance protein MdtH n=1 Tax=Streptomyces chartreusis NRRL 3882 TaxID=1079985 RepID=A0A2N9B200_STRCX|nr:MULTISPECIES: MFS transporter [Streptomyces]MYS93521.1 MFS transporter [Streptomyces sp. SID5464]SOR77356.1 Multidrug resistance protein MdtH [Streptomyces chartreusis NRRL 3882]